MSAPAVDLGRVEAVQHDMGPPLLVKANSHHLGGYPIPRSATPLIRTVTARVASVRIGWAVEPFRGDAAGRGRGRRR